VTNTVAAMRKRLKPVPQPDDSGENITDLETRLNNGNLSTIYCTQCMSSTHTLGILTHLNNHHK
jgi:uncharacterized protein YvpB